AGAQSQFGLVFLERCAAEVSSLERAQYILVSESRTIQRDADAGGEDGIDKTSRISDQHHPVSGELLHGVAVVAFVFERTNLLRTLRLQTFVQLRTALDALPEKLLARLPAL